MLKGSAKAVYDLLFADGASDVYGVLDGASVPELAARLATQNAPSCCLYSGELQPDLAQAAPYLVQLHREAAITDWVLTNGFGNHWGIFARTPAGLLELRRHLRSLLMVRDPQGQAVYFRFYDPRVLGIYLSSCTPQEAGAVFGPLRTIWVEQPPARMAAFRRGAVKVIRRNFDVMAT